MPLPDTGPDPHGVLAWLNAIFETLKQAYAGLLVPTGFAIAWIVNKRGATRDKAQERAEARRKSEEEEHQRIADQLDQESAERFALIRQENAALRTENADLRAGRLRWFDAAHRMRHVGDRLLAGRGEMPTLPYDLEQEP